MINIVILIFGILTFIFMVFAGVVWYLWGKRKLIKTEFLTESGHWELKSWKKQNIGKIFYYDNEAYEYDIKNCTRDSVNRPIAQYYKGNPKQMIFDSNLTNKKINIGTNEITGKDFRVLMLSKVLRDIFTDDEVIMWFIIILAVMVLCFLAIGYLVWSHNPECTLSIDSLDAINHLIRPNAPSLKG